MPILHDFYSDPKLAGEFFALQELVFPSISIVWANENDFLSPNVVPFGIFEADQALSILNATRLHILTGSSTARAVQIGTVATHPELRGRGYSAQLMRHVAAHYAPSIDFMFLFANDTVLEFYPKFGFEPCCETTYAMAVAVCDEASGFRKLDVGKPEDLGIVHELIARRVPIAKSFCVLDYSFLAEWYCQKFYQDGLYYSEALNLLLVASQEGSTLVIYDIVADRLDENFLLDFSFPGVTEVVLQFIPDRFKGDFTPRIDNESRLFVQGAFPGRGRPLKFPPLAHT